MLTNEITIALVDDNHIVIQLKTNKNQVNTISYSNLSNTNKNVLFLLLTVTLHSVNSEIWTEKDR